MMRTQIVLGLLWLGVRKTAGGFGRFGAFTRKDRRLELPLRASRHVAPPRGAENDDGASSDPLSLTRRDAASHGLQVALASWAALAPIFAEPKPAWADGATASLPKVVVLGGSGFVGSQIVEILKTMDIPVVSTSTSGRDGTTALDLTSSDASSILKGILADGATTAVISCVGRIGTDDDEAVNAATGSAAIAAKAAGVERFVYITVAPEVREFASGIDFLSGYMRGKAFSREAVLQQFGDKATLIEPTFIYGGGSFETNPPRVPDFYGKFIEGLLSASPVRQVERILSPGIVKIALEPPVPVNDVARAAVAGALGRSPMSVLDSYDKIKQAAAAIG